MSLDLPPELRLLADAQHGALLGSQIAAVLGKKQVTRLAGRGAVIRLWRNAYALPAHAGSPATRLRAAELTLGRAVIGCLDTAAALHGFGLASDSSTHILADHDWPNDVTSVRQHRFITVRPPATVGDLVVSDLAETCIRLACRETDPAKVLAVLDNALRRVRVDRAALTRVAADLRIRGIRLVRELLPFADGRAQSPGESWLRWVCLEAGFPAATPQVLVTTLDFSFYLLDLGWPERRVGLEYEGVEFHTGAALTKDRRRFNALGRQGWLMYSVTSPMIWDGRPKLVRDIGSMLDERAA